jgi:undecaprenyl-diphosphatase
MSNLSEWLRRALSGAIGRDVRASARLAARLATDGPARHAAAAIAHSGDGALWATAGLVGLACGSQRTRRLVWRAGLSVLLASGSVALIKRAVRRQRPRPPGQERIPLWAAHDRYSFPSGHSARLLATATVVTATHPAAGAALGVWSAVVGLSRVALGAHYLFDVAAGLATGVLAGGAARCLTPGVGTRTPSDKAALSW